MGIHTERMRRRMRRGRRKRRRREETTLPKRTAQWRITESPRREKSIMKVKGKEEDPRVERREERTERA
jgi:hypothetical protein